MRLCRSFITFRASIKPDSYTTLFMCARLWPYVKLFIDVILLCRTHHAAILHSVPSNIVPRSTKKLRSTRHQARGSKQLLLESQTSPNRWTGEWAKTQHQLTVLHMHHLTLLQHTLHNIWPLAIAACKRLQTEVQQATRSRNRELKEGQGQRKIWMCAKY